MSQFFDINVLNFAPNPNMSVNKVLTQQFQQNTDSKAMPQQLLNSHQTQQSESDERKKFEKFRLYKLQQKRLQEMSFTKDNSNSSADHLIKNIIQKVDSEAKLDKRINATSKQNIVNPAFTASSVSSISASVMTPINPNIANYYPQYSNTTLNSVPQNVSHLASTQPLMTSVNHFQQQQYINSYQTSSQSYPQTLSLNPTPILSRMFPNPVSEPNYSSNEAFNGMNRIEKSYLGSYTPNTSLTQVTQKPAMTEVKHSFDSDSNATQLSTSLNTSLQPTSSSKGETNFVTNSAVQPPLNHSIKREIPLCFGDDTKMPDIYLKVWNYVQINEMSCLCDTNKLYAVLLSGGLPQMLLAQVWTHVNNTIPGQLTRQELYMALALIALIQKNSPNPVEELYKLDSLPIPSLQLFPDSHQVHSQYFQNEKHESLEQTEPEKKTEIGTMQLKDNLSNEKLQISPNYNIDVDDDDFADFKSADFNSVQVPDQPNQVISEQSSSAFTSSDVNDDEFDDFKYATIDENNTLKSTPFMEIKAEDEKKTKRASLTDALFSNISAIAPISQTSNSSNSSSNTIPSISVTSIDNSGGNILDSNSQSSEYIETTTTAESNTGSVDKYSVFRELLVDDNSSKCDDFGDFLSHATNYDAESVDSLQFGHQDSDNDNIESLRHQIMQTCRQLIHKAFNVLVVNHGEQSVIQAMNTNEGKNFALDLLEVYGIAKRVWKNFRPNDRTNENFIKLMSDIENTWNTVSSVFAKASLDIELNDENVNVNNNSSQCAICCSKAASEQTFVTFAGFDYHSSCANLWLNCVNSTLPQPTIHCR